MSKTSKKKTPIHPHHKADTLLVVLVPADQNLGIEFKLIPGDLDSMQKLVDGYIERTLSSIVLPCGCNTAMIVNEEGLLRGMSPNPRATRLLTHELLQGLRDPIRGDVFLVGEGPVLGSDGVEKDWFTMPPSQDVVEFVIQESASR